MAENDATREERQTLASAVKEYREGLYEDPSRAKEVAQEVSEKWGVTQKDIRAASEAGA